VFLTNTCDFVNLQPFNMLQTWADCHRHRDQTPQTTVHHATANTETSEKMVQIRNSFAGTQQDKSAAGIMIMLALHQIMSTM
jgi:hypothetical protein